MEKESKKILIVSRSFYPENSARSLRTTELAKGFAKLGHNVKVLTPYDDAHPAFSKEYNISIEDLGQPSFKNVKLKGKGLERLFRRALVRFPKLLFEYPDIEYMWLVKNALKKESGYDLMVSIAVPYPIHWGTAWARSKKNNIAKTWVADCGDPYVGAENDSFKKPFYFSFVEKWFCRNADFISVPFDGAKTAYFSEFVEKIKVIPQGFTFPKINNGSNNEKTDYPVFAYVGNIESYLHYAIPFFEKLNTVKERYKFIVYTKRPDIFKKYLSDDALSKCDLRDYVPRETLFSDLADVNFLVHFPYENETQRSLKLIDYAHMKKPILSFQNDKKSLCALDEFLNFNYKRQLTIENPDQYRIENVCKQFLMLKEVMV